MRRGVGANLTRLFGAAAITKPLTFITSLLVARLLGPSVLGSLALAQLLVSYGALVSDAGLTELTLRDIVLKPQCLSLSVCITTAVQTVLALMVIGLLAVAALSGAIPLGAGTLLLLSAPALIAYALGLTYALQAVDDIRTVAKSRVLTTVITSAATIGAVALTHTAYWVCVAAWTGPLAGDVYVAWALRRNHGLRFEKFGPTAMVKTSRRGAPFLVNGVLIGILGLIDSLSIAIFGSRHQLGIYNAAWQVSVTAWFTVTLVIDGVYPEMVRRWNSATPSFAAFLDRIVGLTTRMGLAGVAFIVAEAGPFVRLLFGPHFAAAASVLQVEIWLFPLGYLAFLLNFGLFAMNQQKAVVRRRAVVIVFAVVACPLAASLGGIVYVAGSMVAALVFECLLLAALAARHSQARVVPAALRQLPYLVVPATALVLAQRVVGAMPILAALVVWSLAIVTVEAPRKFPTLQMVRQVSKDARS